MRKSAALFAALAILLTAPYAFAGVIITQNMRMSKKMDVVLPPMPGMKSDEAAKMQQAMRNDMSAPVEFHAVMMLQADKMRADLETQMSMPGPGGESRSIDFRRTFITDNRTHKSYYLDSGERSYYELPYPPTGMAAGFILQGLKFSPNLKRTGATRTIAGYKCQVYEGNGEISTGKMTISECISKDAPGAQELTALGREVAAQLKKSGNKFPPPGQPEGLPLESDSTSEITTLPPSPGITPEVSAMAKEMMPHGMTMTMSMIVTKIEEKQLSDDIFEIPPGYTKAKAGSWMDMMKAEMMKAGGSNPLMSGSTPPTSLPPASAPR